MTISVTQLNNYIKGIFDLDGVLGDLCVAGEITNVKRARDGWYFSLKDENSAINCFCYSGSCPDPIVGATCIAEGQCNYFARTGSVSFFVRRLTATSQTGAAYLQFLQLKEKLQKEGLFDEIRKQAVPSCCRNIGVVTSDTGAVIHDITNVALRRQPFSNILLYPVKVQGVGADVEIANGINYFAASNVDVVIVGRGGGSNEDLSAFNSELVVRAIAACNKPVVSAVGHGIDYTLCDFVADRRAVTPSEAAEFVTIDTAAAKAHILAKLQLAQLLLVRKMQHMQDNVLRNLQVSSGKVANAANMACAQIEHNLQLASNKVANRIAQCDTRLVGAISKLDSLNPAKVLKRGYGFVANAGGAVTSIDQVAKGDNVTITLTDGALLAVVTQKEKK